jgi:protein-S-isoprenylcysteine O-methyltransferase Ste14
MWTVRLILLGGLVAMTSIDFYMLPRRKKHQWLIENRVFNALGVVAYNACCYLMAVLPPAGGWDRRPAWLMHPGVHIGFVVVGSALICFGVVLFLISVRQRKVLGLQDVQTGLLTSGAYRYFRHPIYAGILWVSLGLALLTRNPDGLLMFPALLGVFVAQALIEEKYDMAVRFHEQYRDYRHTARMFGPAWLWSTIVVTILLIASSGWRH